jgi:hypothetical protein
MRHPLERSRHDPVFLSQPTPTLLLGRDFTIEAVTRSYLASTGRSEDELVAVNVFEAFPENPATREVGATKDFTDSFERVLRTGRPHYVSPLRYDLQDPCHPGEFIEKRWVLVNTPIRDGDDVIGVMVRVDDVTLANEDLLKALRVYRDTLAQADLHLPDARDRLDTTTSFLSVVETYSGLASEVTDLRQALRSRPAIEQAKGIIMADRKCSAEEAFDLLKQLSMETNVRIADVAAAVIYQLRAPRRPGPA